MAVLIVLIVLALLALIIVSAINRKQEQEQARRTQQRKLKLQVDATVDVVNCLEQTIPNRMIAKHVNDESIVLLPNSLSPVITFMPGSKDTETPSSLPKDDI